MDNHELSVPIYTAGWTEAVWIKCLAQGHNAPTPRLEPPTFRSAVKRTNHSATALHLCTNWWDAPLYTYSRVAISGTPPGDRSITVRAPAGHRPITARLSYCSGSSLQPPDIGRHMSDVIDIVPTSVRCLTDLGRGDLGQYNYFGSVTQKQLGTWSSNLVCRLGGWSLLILR